jgi:hypothetical protein
MNKDQEEFEKLRKRLYALAEKMGQRLTMTLRRKSNALAPEPAQQTKAPGEPGEE